MKKEEIAELISSNIWENDMKKEEIAELILLMEDSFFLDKDQARDTAGIFLALEEMLVGQQLPVVLATLISTLISLIGSHELLPEQNFKRYMDFNYAAYHKMYERAIRKKQMS